MSGSEYQKTKEDAATIMREKQRKGGLQTHDEARSILILIPLPADEKKAAEAAGGKKK